MAVYKLIDKAARAGLAALGALSKKDKAAAADIDTTGANAGQVLTAASNGSASWQTPAAGGAPTSNTSSMTVSWTDAAGNTIQADMTSGS